MKRSRMSKVFWWAEGRRLYFTINLTHWGLAVQFPPNWYVQLLCFEIGKS